MKKRNKKKEKLFPSIDFLSTFGRQKKKKKDFHFALLCNFYPNFFLSSLCCCQELYHSPLLLPVFLLAIQPSTPWLSIILSPISLDRSNRCAHRQIEFLAHTRCSEDANLFIRRFSTSLNCLTCCWYFPDFFSLFSLWLPLLPKKIIFKTSWRSQWQMVENGNKYSLHPYRTGPNPNNESNHGNDTHTKKEQRRIRSIKSVIYPLHESPPTTLLWCDKNSPVFFFLFPFFIPLCLRYHNRITISPTTATVTVLLAHANWKSPCNPDNAFLYFYITLKLPLLLWGAATVVSIKTWLPIDIFLPLSARLIQATQHPSRVLRDKTFSLFSKQQRPKKLLLWCDESRVRRREKNYGKIAEID